jgi:hypothetical protein
MLNDFSFIGSCQIANGPCEDCKGRNPRASEFRSSNRLNGSYRLINAHTPSPSMMLFYALTRLPLPIQNRSAQAQADL